MLESSWAPHFFRAAHTQQLGGSDQSQGAPEWLEINSYTDRSVKKSSKGSQSQLRVPWWKRTVCNGARPFRTSETSSLPQAELSKGWTFNRDCFDFSESAHLFSIRHLLNFLTGLSATELNIQEWQMQVQVWDYPTLRQMFLSHCMHQRQQHWERAEFSFVPLFIHPAALCVFLAFIFVFHCLTSVQTVWDRGSWGSSWRFEIHITVPLKPVRWSDSRGSANSLCSGEICFSVHDYLCILFPLSLIVSILIKSRGVRTWENLSAEQGWLWFKLVY